MKSVHLQLKWMVCVGGSSFQLLNISPLFHTFHWNMQVCKRSALSCAFLLFDFRKNISYANSNYMQFHLVSSRELCLRHVANSMGHSTSHLSSQHTQHLPSKGAVCMEGGGGIFKHSSFHKPHTRTYQHISSYPQIHMHTLIIVILTHANT